MRTQCTFWFFKEFLVSISKCNLTEFNFPILEILNTLMCTKRALKPTMHTLDYLEFLEARLCLWLRFRFVVVPRLLLRNLFYLDFIDVVQVIVPAASNGENRRMLCNKTFCQKIPDFSPDSGFFRNFFISPWSLDHFWDIMFNKVVYILISLGGDSKSMCYVVTEGRKHTTSKFIY